MAKTQIKNYVFKPGIGANDSRFPNAYGLISSNKSFIQKEMSAFIANRVATALQYTPTAAVYTPTTGVLLLTIGTHNLNIGDAIIIAAGGITFTNSSAGAVPFLGKALIVTGVTANVNITVDAGVSTDTATHTWISSVTNATQDTFYNYTNTSVLKCERDVGYILDSYLNDLRYGGNEKTYNNIKYYWDQTVAQVDGSRGPELVAHYWIGQLIQNNILAQVSYTSLQTEVVQTTSGTATEATAQFTPTDATYIPTTGKMTITIGSHTLQVGDEIHIAPAGITFTCALDGNATLHPYPRASGVPNTKGKDPYYYAPITITSVTSTTVTASVGISSDTSLHTFSSAVTNSVTSGPAAKINTLAFNTVDTIQNGLLSLPKLVDEGVGSVKFQGKYSIDEILLITNSTKSEVIYNFTSITTGGVVTINTNSVTEDLDFAKFLQITDGITTIKLNYNTSAHSSTDDIQLFVEQIENGKSVVTTRPYDFGTDAIERPRAANPLSMLDADFEYGLQPTKWAAIATLRGYPSVYEVPGTDTQVVSVVTDASAGTSGIGQSLITVTTVGPHGFTAGTPITIKALEDSVNGAARAEGSFVIVEIPTTSTFTFYAKSKVGTVNPTTLSTTYTQLRQAGFYTGATIGNPTFTVVSNGSSGTITTQLGIATGETIIPFDGGAPEIGSPLTNAAIPTGSQVTSIIDTSAGGGTYLTPIVTDNTAIAGTRVYLEDTTGIVNSLALDKGDGTATYINNVTATYIDVTDAFTAAIVPNKKTYPGIGGTNDTNNGINATFNIALDGNAGRTYTVAVNAAGTLYKIGDRLKLDGITLGGVSGTNDIVITVASVAANGGILTVTHVGVHWDGTLSLTGISGSYTPAGTGALWDLAYTAGSYTSVTQSSGTVVFASPTMSYAGSVGFGAKFAVTKTGTAYTATITTAGQDFVVNETFTILGENLGGVTPGNNATITIDTVGASDAIASISITGVGLDTTDASASFVVADLVEILGSDIGGTSPANDLYIVVDTVDGSGAITGSTATGTPPFVNLSFSTSIIGLGTYAGSSGTSAVFGIAASNGNYAVSITQAGGDYQPTETFVILGTSLGGATPANDLTITIDNVGGTGDITAITATGSATTTGSKYAVASANKVGVGATFDVAIAGSGYTTSINAGGTFYGSGQVLTVSGVVLSGTSPANNLTINVTAIDAVTTGVITGISSSGTAATAGGPYTAVSPSNMPILGAGATFEINKNFTSYDSVAPSALGTGYALGDRIILPGTAFDGASPANDIVLTVSNINAGTGAIGGTTPNAAIANYGTNLDLISTITMTEATTAPISINQSITFSAIAIIDATFDNAHGLVPGASFITTITSDADGNNHNLTAGSYIATNIPTVNSLRFNARAVGAINVSSNVIQGEVYPRPDSFFVHRPFDGGVMLGTGGPQHGAQAIRQSKKYIRYQSGKGIMYTTGALFAPSYDIRSITADGIEVNSLITIVTDDNDHGVQPGGIVRLIGVETPGFNSGEQTAVPPKFDYTVEEVVDERTFKVRAVRRLGATTAVLGFGSQMSVVAWHGATVRSGIFDDQNGIFWEFDGTNVSVNQRTGTRQLAGTIALTVDNNLIVGTNTRFQDQLKAGDRVVIKGMTHVVSHVNSQTGMTVTPDWRGVVNITGAKINLVADKKVKQRDFNLDRLDGTGPSGYDIDIAKMQMIGIQYSWYGAGFIDFMLRGANGNFVFAHRMRNSNINTEAFMRSGNLPVRYEVTNEGPSGKLAAGMTNSQTTLKLFDGSFFPYAGTIYIDNEIITFTGRTDNTLTGLTRGATFTNFQAGANRSYTAAVAATHADRTGVILISQTITPLISHWGSAFITDGGFDSDRGYIFSYAETAVEVTTTKQTAFMIRLAPSVSNALIGDLGTRELLNRAQLLLTGLEVTSESGAGGIVIEGVLNPQNYPTNPNDVGWSGLSGVAQGGQPSFAQIASGGGVTWSTGAAATTANITSVPNITGVINSGSSNWGNNNRYINVSANDFEAVFGERNIDLVLGKPITGAGIPSNTTIQDGYIDNSGNYGYFRLNNRANGVSSGTVDAYTITFNVEGTNRNYGYFTVGSFDASAGKVGTTVTGGNNGITVPANTQINSVTLLSYAGTDYYEVTFNNSFTGTLQANSGTLALEFVQPPFAQPGETIFSFIAVPGERSTLDLNDLKELTNTPLGGRGTYPNGPDVLAINVYKVSGSAIDANIIIRWGEAQA